MNVLLYSLWIQSTMELNFVKNEEFAKSLDKDDILSKYRDYFFIPKQDQKEVIYFNGNSLGLQPKSVRKLIDKEIDDWKDLGSSGYFMTDTPWVTYHESLIEPMARLVGAKPIEVVIMNTLTVNLHFLMISFYRPTEKRHKILIEYSSFPSDQYAIKSQLKYHGYDPSESLIMLKPRVGEELVREDDVQDIINTQGDSIALILIGNPNYFNGQVYNIEKITKWGHNKGCVVGFNLAHGVGNLKLELHDWDVDFAIWCSYKYLNSGPGGLSGCFINERYANDPDLPKFTGWWGNKLSSRMLMKDDIEISEGATGWQTSNHPIFSLIPIKSSLEIFDDVGIDKLREKSILMTKYLYFLLESISDITIITPNDEEQRGCQLSLVIHKHGKSIQENLVLNGVVCDWREPNVIRIAPAPIYNSYHECWKFVQILQNLLD